MESWDSELCCACLGRNLPGAMYSLADPETNALFKECTNIRIFSYEQVRYLCLMCYKQCEIWKCFKTRCQNSRALLGRCMEDVNATTISLALPQYSGADQQQHPVEVKQEPQDDYFADSAVEEITVGAAYTLNGTDEDMFTPQNDPLEEGGSIKKKRGRRKKIKTKQEQDDDSYSPSVKGKSGALLGRPSGSSRRSKMGLECVNSGNLKIKINLQSPSKDNKKMRQAMAQAANVSEASLDQYLKTYNDFVEWKTKTQPPSREINEAMLIDFFQKINSTYSPKTLVNKLSHLVTMISTFHGVDVSSFGALREYVRSIKDPRY